MRPVWRVAVRLAYGPESAQRRRLVLVMAASGLAAVVLLAVLGAVHAVQREAGRFDARRIQPVAAGRGTLEVKAGYDTWRGQQYPVIWLRPAAEQAPLPPGMTALPPSGGWYVSPALAALARHEPGLASRFPRSSVLGDDGVLNPGELLAYRRLPDGGSLGQYAIPVRHFGGAGSRGLGIGDATELNVPPIAMAAAGLVGLPLLLLLLSALTISSPVRVQRMLTLHALGMPRAQRRRLIGYETLLAATPGVLTGALAWTLTARRLGTLPLVGRPVTVGDLVPPPLTTAAAVVGLLAAIVLLSIVLLDSRRLRPSPRPVAGSQALRHVRWLPLTAGAVLLLSSLAGNGKGAALATLAGVLLTCCGLPLVLPFLARAVGGAVARSGGPGRLLAGRGLQRAPLSAVRPLYGLAAILVITPVVATWLAIARQADPPAKADRAVQGAVLTGALEAVDPTALQTAEPAAVVLAIKGGADRGQQVFADCAQVRRLLGAHACTGNSLTPAGKDRLNQLVGRTDDYVLGASTVIGRPDEIHVLGTRGPFFEDRIRAAALNQDAAVAVYSEEDLMRRESPLVAWILGGCKALGVLLFAALAVSLISRSVGDPATRRLLGALGLTTSQVRSVQLHEFLLGYGVVLGFGLAAGIGCSFIWHALSPSPYPYAAILGLAGTFLALGAVVVAALYWAQRPGTPQHPGGSSPLGSTRQP